MESRTDEGGTSVKRLLCIMTVCILLLGLASAEEGRHYHVTLRCGMEDAGAETIEVDLFPGEDGQLGVVSSALKESILLSAEESPAIAMLPAHMDSVGLFNRVSAIRSLLAAWADRQPGETIDGLFMGELFTGAREEKRFSWTPEEALAFWQELFGDSEVRLPVEISGIPASGEDAACQVTGKIYGNGDFVTWTVHRQAESLATFSLDISREQTIDMLLGYGENEKDYYLFTELRSDAEKLTGESIWLADDERLGFSQLGREQIICSLKTELTEEADASLRLEASLQTARFREPFRMTARLTAGDLNIELYTNEQNPPFLSLQMREEKAEIPETFDLIWAERSIEQETAVQSEVASLLLRILYPLMDTLPSELIMNLLW